MRRRDQTARPLRVVHYSSAVNTLLAPDIVEAILDGRQPPQLTLAWLMKPFPLQWERQRKWIQDW